MKVVKHPFCIVGGGPVGVLMSKFLSQYQVPHCLIERKTTPTRHPQAHFINMRTMEIMKSHFFSEFHSVIKQTPELSYWRFIEYLFIKISIYHYSLLTC